MLKKILSAPTEKVGKAGRFAITQLKLWSHCARLLRKNRAGQQAAALSYHTIFGIVPLAIVTLWFFQLSPTYNDIGQKLKGFIYKEAHFTEFKSPASENQNSEKTVALTDYLDGLIAEFFKSANKGSITVVSAVIVIWAALALLSTIERAFNNIWHVPRGRNFLHRMINYWALVTLGPLLIAVGIYIATKSATLGRIQQTILSNVAPTLLSYLVSTVAFFLLYFVLPNTKVKAKSAIWGAAVAALVWVVARILFGYSVTQWKLYSTLYGALALIPITVLWIYITWLIVLFGLQLTFTTQHLKTLDAAEIAAAKKTEEYFIANDLTAINIVRQVAAGFEANSAPVSSEIICSKLDIPGEFGSRVLDHLVATGILIKSAEPRVGYIPAQDPANIKLSEIADAVAKAGFGQPEELDQISRSQRSVLAQYNLKQILDPKETD